jgi:hypothetical protein
MHLKVHSIKSFLYLKTFHFNEVNLWFRSRMDSFSWLQSASNTFSNLKHASIMLNIELQRFSMSSSEFGTVALSYAIHRVTDSSPNRSLVTTVLRANFSSYLSFEIYSLMRLVASITALSHIADATDMPVFFQVKLVFTVQEITDTLHGWSHFCEGYSGLVPRR